MANQAITKVTIVGGGTAGWMTAAAMSTLLDLKTTCVELVESSDIPNVGVGEATIPQIQLFNQLLGIDEVEFVRETNATFKHGIEFVDWAQKGERYIHPFGTIGLNFDGLDFHHYWLKLFKQGLVEDIQQFAFNSVAARNGKMAAPINRPDSPLSGFSYAYHFDAGLYVEFLKKLAIGRGVLHTLGTVAGVETRQSDGFITSLSLEDGTQIDGQLFIDCSGFHSKLTHHALNVEYEDWRHWLPCDSAVVVQSELSQSPEPYTRSTAREAGWQWRIPLQHRMGNGYVYSSAHQDDESARETLLRNLEGRAIGEPRLLRFKGGRRKQAWTANCIAIGLSAGFIEPLESTAIHLIQSAISRLMSLFPDRSCDQHLVDTYNRHTQVEMEGIRDFIICHYKLTRRDDTSFWRHCKDMVVPESLSQKIALFSSQGRIFREQEELFNQTSWLSVMLGQGCVPESYHPLADRIPEQELLKRFGNISAVIKATVDRMPTQDRYLRHLLGVNQSQVSDVSPLPEASHV